MLDVHAAVLQASFPSLRLGAWRGLANGPVTSSTSNKTVFRLQPQPDQGGTEIPGHLCSTRSQGH